MKKVEECMIIRDGKMVFAIKLNTDGTSKDTRGPYVHINNGKLYFSDCYFSPTAFNIGDESHRIAKEIFVSQLEIDIKSRVKELQQLNAIFKELGIESLLSNFVNDALLLATPQDTKQSKA